MSGHEAGQSIEATAWKVQLPNGELCFMTLDELDEEFQAGNIDEKTHVLSPGSQSWEKLGELLGIEAAPAAVAAAPVVAPAPVAIAHAPAPLSSHAPVAFVPEAPTSMAFQSVAYSVRPVVADLADDLEPEAFRPRKRRAPLVVGFVAVALAAAGIFVARSGALSTVDSSASVAAAAAANVASAPVAPAAPVVTPQPSAPSDGTPTPVYGGIQHKSFNSEPAPLTAAQKKALADADARLEAKRAKKHGGRGHSKHPTGAQPFHNGGAAGDPLNSKI